MRPKSPSIREEKPPLSHSHFKSYHTPGFYATLSLDENEKNRVRFIQSVESLVRTSHEYRAFLSYLKKEAELTYCSLMGTVSKDVLGDLSIEIHHYPVTLFDLVDTVLNRALNEGLPFTRLSLANEVVELHYALKVGLVPLTTTAHQLAHSGYVLIDPRHVFGDHEAFVKEYRMHIRDEAMDRYIGHIEKTKDLEFVKAQNSRMLELDDRLFVLPSPEEDEGSDVDEDF